MQMYIVDAFTDRAFGGNPAAVALLSEEKPTIWMQQVATEMNLSETAFLFKQARGYLLRWFTPIDEVDLCGHATLASAHILWTEGLVEQGEKIYFQTKSGILSAEQVDGLIQLDFPLEPDKECLIPEFLIEGLGVTPLYVGKNRMDYFVEVESETILKCLKPNYNLLGQVKCRGVVVTSRSDSDDFDFVSRCFYPASGVNEDPVTGSAHCGLGPYWKRKLHKNEMTAFQCSARGGILKLKLMDGRILISGQAITTLRGTFKIDFT
jgi:predicted PhzF superfamily epimerase YddE/YHI9